MKQLYQKPFEQIKLRQPGLFLSGHGLRPAVQELEENRLYGVLGVGKGLCRSPFPP